MHRYSFPLTTDPCPLQDSLAESEEKYRKAMVSNAQLHNEKSNLMYQVDTLKEALIELEEQLWESRREYGDKTKVRGQGSAYHVPLMGPRQCI